MPPYYALVDAMTGRETEVEAALRAERRILGAIRNKDGNHDFLVKFDAGSFSAVDDFLQTHVRRIQGVVGVEIVVDWENHAQSTRDARVQLG